MISSAALATAASRISGDMTCPRRSISHAITATANRATTPATYQATTPFHAAARSAASGRYGTDMVCPFGFGLPVPVRGVEDALAVQPPCEPVAQDDVPGVERVE